MTAKRKGFTLIELLVVISIIALLLAILMPSLTKVKKQAKAVACQANLRQWGLVLNFYTDDNNGYFMSGSGGSHFEWMEPARPYYKEDEMRFCPMAKKNEEPGTDHWGSTFTTWETGDFVGSYGINEFLFNPNPSMDGMFPVRGTSRLSRIAYGSAGLRTLPMTLPSGKESGTIPMCIT